MLVLIDTNVFVRETHLLRKKAGPPFIHFLRAAKGKLLVPELLEREYREQTVAAVADEARAIEGAFGKIQSLVGVRDDYKLPSPEEVLASVEERMRELEPLTHAMPTSDATLLAASKRSIDKRAPSSKTDHGLKDCVIWESVLSLPPESEVWLVSRDNKAFIAEGKLPDAMLGEAQHRGIEVRAFGSLEAALRELQSSGAPVLDSAAVAANLHEAVKPLCAKLVAQWSLSTLSEAPVTELEPYYTESSRRLYVTFSLSYAAGEASVGGVSYSDTTVRLEGSFVWLVDEERHSELQVEREALVAHDGSFVSQNHSVFVSASISLGRRRVPYSVRQPLLRSPPCE